MYVMKKEGKELQQTLRIMVVHYGLALKKSILQLQQKNSITNIIGKQTHKNGVLHKIQTDKKIWSTLRDSMKKQITRSILVLLFQKTALSVDKKQQRKNTNNVEERRIIKKHTIQL